MRLVARLLVLLPLLWVEGVWAVDCRPEKRQSFVDGSIVEMTQLETQQEVDDFQTLYGPCDTVVGELQIFAPFVAQTDINDLSPLSDLVSVGHLMVWNNPLLMNLQGLENLVELKSFYLFKAPAGMLIDELIGVTSLEAGLQIEDSQISDLSGLSNVNIIGGAMALRWSPNISSFDIFKNADLSEARVELSSTSLADLGFLENQTTLKSLLLTDNPNLTSSNLTKLLRIEDQLYLAGDQSFSDLQFLSSLTELGRLEISGSALNSVDGLEKITQLSYVQEGYFTSLRLYESSIADLSALAGLERMFGHLEIYNSAIRSLEGLQSLSDAAGVSLISNGGLADCSALAPLLNWPVGPPSDLIGLRYNAVGCNSIEQILSSVSGPTKPVVNEATTSSNRISLGFNPSTTTDTLFPITGYSASCIGSDVDVSVSPTIDLLDNTPIQETLTVTGYDPTSVLSSIEVDVDITHSDPTDLYITLTSPKGTEVILWSQGSSGGQDLVGTFPTSLTSVDSFEAVSSGSMDGDWVLSIEDIDVGPLVREGVLNSWGIRITEELSATGAGSPIAVTGITQGREYQCRLAPVTKLGKVPESEPFIINPSATTVFSRLLDTVLKTTHDSVSQSAMDGGRSRPPQARAGEEEVEKPNPIPTLPMLGLFILSGLLALFGIRRLAHR